MSITLGDKLGPYEVTAKIGEGGMGEVYQARDTKLNRNVAPKVLPDLFASDPHLGWCSHDRERPENRRCRD